ncbi:MAG: ParB/RepB/Spo0J family partition protein [Parvularculaceae bacterium]
MELQTIPLDRLAVSALNMRASRKKPYLDDILPSIRERGVLVPLLVRPNGKENHFEIVAGRRRFLASKTIEKETGEARDLPCRVLEEGDDAAAVEASILENTARLEPDEMQEFEAFKKLNDKGKSVEEIARIFGVTELTVKRRLALASLIPGIRKAYAEDDIDGASITALTLASVAKQREWFEMFKSADMRAPRGSALKRWLLGGGEIETGAALFSLEDYDGDIFEDLFGERSVFADAGKFWARQEAAIEAEREKLISSGWSKVTLLPRGEFFHSWEYDQLAKKQGGEVFVEVRHSGEVAFIKGYAPRRKTHAAKEKTRAERPECSAPLENYVDLHRHAAARAVLLKHQQIAMRLLAAHLIAGAPNIRCQPDRQATRKEETAASVAASKGQEAFERERSEIGKLLDLDEPSHITGGNEDGWRLASIFAKMMTLSDADIARILTFVAAEIIAAGHEAVDCLARALAIDIADWMTPDDAFFELLRDKNMTNAMLADIAGDSVAKANCDAAAKAQKAIIRDCLDGRNGREKTPNWRPRWLQFPALSYTQAGKPGAVKRAEKISPLFTE